MKKLIVLAVIAVTFMGCHNVSSNIESVKNHEFTLQNPAYRQMFKSNMETRQMNTIRDIKRMVMPGYAKQELLKTIIE